MHDGIMLEMGEFKILADDTWENMMAMRMESISAAGKTQGQKASFTFSQYVRAKRAPGGKCRMLIFLLTRSLQS